MSATLPEVLTLNGTDRAALDRLLGRFDIMLQRVPDRAAIPGSFWGEPEAGVVRNTVFARGDTPLHSILHESCHIICMDPRRRDALDRDAGGDDLEEAAVCYLQVLLADTLDGVGSARLMADMDAWGYSFRLGSTARWFCDDAADARAWLCREGLLNLAGDVLFRCRGSEEIQYKSTG